MNESPMKNEIFIDSEVVRLFHSTTTNTTSTTAANVSCVEDCMIRKKVDDNNSNNIAISGDMNWSDIIANGTGSGGGGGNGSGGSQENMEPLIVTAAESSEYATVITGSSPTQPSENEGGTESPQQGPSHVHDSDHPPTGGSGVESVVTLHPKSSVEVKGTSTMPTSSSGSAKSRTTNNNHPQQGGSGLGGNNKTTTSPPNPTPIFPYTTGGSGGGERVSPVISSVQYRPTRKESSGMTSNTNYNVGGGGGVGVGARARTSTGGSLNQMHSGSSPEKQSPNVNPDIVPRTGDTGNSPPGPNPLGGGGGRGFNASNLNRGVAAAPWPAPAASPAVSASSTRTSPNRTPPIEPGTHSLQSTWCLWLLHDRQSLEVAWKDKMLEAHSFNSVEGFWRMHHNIHGPSFLGVGDYYLFRRGITPDWNDPVFQFGGGRLIIQLPSRYKMLDHLWLHVSLLMIGEMCDQCDDLAVCGAVAACRSKLTKIALWISTSSARRVIEIAERFFGYTQQLVQNSPSWPGGTEPKLELKPEFESFRKGQQLEAALNLHTEKAVMSWTDLQKCAATLNDVRPLTSTGGNVGYTNHM